MITFVADRVRITGPRIDGTYTLSFEVGEYEYDNAKEVPKLNGGNIQVTCKEYEG